MADRYAKMTQEDFDTILEEIINKHPASHLLTVPGVYEVIREHYNNEVLEFWEAANPEEPSD